MPWDTSHWIALVLTPLLCLLGVALTAITLPGNWLIVAWALGLKLWQPHVVEWWTVLVMIGIALAAEGLEFLASAMGAAKAGASTWGAIGAMLGALVGSILGIMVPPPPLGSIVCGCAGAAVGAVLMERYKEKRSWQESRKAGMGAAVGRLLSMLAKVFAAILLSLMVSLAVVQP